MITDKRLRARLTEPRPAWRERAPEPTADDLAYARILIGDPCSYCGARQGFLDHIDSDQHGWENLTSTCRRCNTAKGQHTLTRFLLAKQLRVERQEGATAQIRALGRSHGPRWQSGECE